MKSFYLNGTILTMEENALYAEAVCTENGKILAVGTQKELMELYQESDEIIDLKGGTMLPGFIDGHSHFVGLANSMTQCDLSFCENFQDLIDTMKHFKNEKQIPDDAWLIGCNYDHNFLKEGIHPDKQVLDQISKTNPVLLIHASSHMGVTNSRGLQIQKIDEHTPDTPDGRYGRVKGSLVPDGYMEERAFLQFQSKLPMHSPKELMQLICEAQNVYASYGITTVQDGMVGKPLFQLLKAASDAGLLKLDVVAYLDIATTADLIDLEPSYTGKYHKHLKSGGYKIFLDGSPQGKTAWMSTPYEGDETYCGYPIYQNEQLRTYIALALDQKQQLLAHCNGDAAAEQYISQFERELNHRKDKNARRAVMVHAQLVRKDQLKRMAEIGMIPSFFVAHTYYWGDIHLKNFGQERGSQISPVGDAVKNHMIYTFHQDSPVIPPDMMQTIFCAVNRITKNGQSIGENQKISVLDALKAITIHAAYQYFEEDRKGSIVPGKYADFVVLDQNPLTADIRSLDKIQVLMTIKENNLVYKKGNNHE